MAKFDHWSNHREPWSRARPGRAHAGRPPLPPPPPPEPAAGIRAERPRGAIKPTAGPHLTGGQNVGPAVKACAFVEGGCPPSLPPEHGVLRGPHPRGPLPLGVSGSIPEFTGQLSRPTCRFTFPPPAPARPSHPGSTRVLDGNPPWRAHAPQPHLRCFTDGRPQIPEKPPEGTPRGKPQRSQPSLAQAQVGKLQKVSKLSLSSQQTFPSQVSGVTFLVYCKST